jgi:alkanesulfonate monooxygenase SsuD/methylene tetrahydromethanopterin reductase-like flavin-dependent oxidoreductase (luciferase family)
MVVCTGFRNAAHTAKLSSTIDVISGGRFELGIGAGWKKDEWEAYGYGFPPIGERMDAFGDDLEVITRMLAPGHATYEGRHAYVRDAINVPKGIQQPRIPIIVGGNGPNVTMRLAARFADELNLVFRSPDSVVELMGVPRQRCEEIDRDPATLRISLYVADTEVQDPGRHRIDLLGRLEEIGLDRIVAFPTRYGAEPDVQASFAEDCRAAGLLAESRRAVPAG